MSPRTPRRPWFWLCAALAVVLFVVVLPVVIERNASAQGPTLSATPAPSPAPTSESPEDAIKKKTEKEEAGEKISDDPRLQPTDWTYFGLNLALVIALTLINALFSMAETALISLRRSRVEQLCEEKQRGAQAVKRLINDPHRFIATVQVGITLLGFASAAAAATTLAQPFIVPLYRLGFSVNVANNIAIGFVTLMVAILAMVLGEIAPKSLAVQSPDTWALRLAPMVNVCAILFKPITGVVIAFSNALVRPFGVKAQFETPVITKEELEHIIEGSSGNELDKEEQTILTNVIDFSETLVKEVMTPRIDMTALPVTADLHAILEMVMKSGHSRLPVYDETIDNIVGMVHAKDLLPIFRADGNSVDLRKVVRPALFVPETKKVSDLLAEMRRSKNQIAIVQDEYAGTEGVVTLEDLLEEIVGEIRDEYDVDEPEIHVLSSRESLIDGRMNLGDVSDRLGIELTSEDYNTLAGLVFGLLGHEPEVGESVQQGEYDFIVESIENRRIRTIRARKRDMESTRVSAN